MCGGGGGGKPPSPADIARAEQMTADREAQRAREQAAWEAEQAEQAARERYQRERREAKQRRRRRRTEADEYVDEFERRLREYMSTIGAGDWTDYWDIAQAEIDARRAGIDFNSDDEMDQYFTDAIEEIEADAIARERDARTSYITNTRRGYDDGYYDDEFGQDIVDEILGQQKADAVAALDRARARGRLTDQGYDEAMQLLEQQYTAGEARLGQSREDVLAGYGNEIDLWLDELLSDAGQWTYRDDLGLEFERGGTETQILPDGTTREVRRDPSGNLTTQIDERAARAGEGFAGDLYNLTGDESYFDWEDILRNAGLRQGVTNPNSGSLLGQAMQRYREREQERGVGTQGVF